MTEDELEQLVARLSGGLGFAREQAGQPPWSLRNELRVRIKDVEKLQAARRRMVEAGLAHDLVQRLSPTHVILLDEKHSYDTVRDERMKLLALPPWQIETIVGGQQPNGPADALFAGFLPPVVKDR
jgi:hypothetical protein